MDSIKEKIEEVAKKITSDKKFAAEFKKDPVKALEKVTGLDLPDDQVKAVVEGVKAKVSLDSIGDMLDSDGDGKPDLGAISKLGGMFSKK